MRTENKCEDCRFFKKHSLLGMKSVETLGGSCLITNKTTECVVSNRVVTFDLQNQCPLKRLKAYERLRHCWSELIKFVTELQNQSERLEFEAKRLLRDVISKINELEKGEN